MRGQGQATFQAAGACTYTNTAWTCTATLPSDYPSGEVGFTIDSYDLAGNALPQVTAVTHGSSVEFDRTAPILTDVSITSTSDGGFEEHKESEYAHETQELIGVIGEGKGKSKGGGKGSKDGCNICGGPHYARD